MCDSTWPPGDGGVVTGLGLELPSISMPSNLGISLIPIWGILDMANQEEHLILSFLLCCNTINQHTILHAHNNMSTAHSSFASSYRTNKSLTCWKHASKWFQCLRTAIYYKILWCEQHSTSLIKCIQWLKSWTNWHALDFQNSSVPMVLRPRTSLRNWIPCLNDWTNSLGLSAFIYLPFSCTLYEVRKTRQTDNYIAFSLLLQKKTT